MRRAVWGRDKRPLANVHTWKSFGLFTGDEFGKTNGALVGSGVATGDGVRCRGGASVWQCWSGCVGRVAGRRYAVVGSGQRLHKGGCWHADHGRLNRHDRGLVPIGLHASARTRSQGATGDEEHAARRAAAEAEAERGANPNGMHSARAAAIVTRRCAGHGCVRERHPATLAWDGEDCV